jgi:HEAT repeat protein
MLGSVLLLVIVLPQKGPADDLKSKDAAVRVQALIELREHPTENAEKLFSGALRDSDWEVLQRAAEGLGTLGAQHELDDLVGLALVGPVRPVRRAAAEALARIDAARAFDALAKRLEGELAPRAWEAILALAPAVDGKVSLDFLERAAKSKDPGTRWLAAKATVAVAGEERAASSRPSARLAAADSLIFFSQRCVLVSAERASSCEFIAQAARSRRRTSSCHWGGR